MPQGQDLGETKHYKGFWPLFIVLVIAACAAIIVYWFQIKLVSDYDNNTSEIRIRRRVSPTSKLKAPVKSTATQSSTPVTK